MFKHIRACGCHITPNEAKWSKAKHSRSLGCRRLMDREASWGVCFCKHQVLFSMQIDLFVVAQLYYVRVEWFLIFQKGETTLETGGITSKCNILQRHQAHETHCTKLLLFFVFCFRSVSTVKPKKHLPICSTELLGTKVWIIWKWMLQYKWRYEVLTLPMSANHISIPTWGKAVSWNRNGLVQWAGGVEVPFVLSCLNTLVNSCQQGSHSAKGQGHLSCVQHIDIVPFHLPLSPLSSSFFSSIISPLVVYLRFSPSILLSLRFPLSSSASLPLPLLLFWWKGVNMQGTHMISSLISAWWMAPAPLLIQ